MKTYFMFFVSVFFALNVSAQSQRGLAVKELAKDGGSIGRQYAVMIAIERYVEWLPLRNPVKDAREIASILKARYEIDELIELYDESATKAGIIKALAALVERTKPEDSVFIFYAGHGHLDATSDTGFWIPQDAGSDRLTQSNWLPNTQIRGFIRNLKARHVLLVSDSCFSGDLLNVSRSLQPEIDDTYFKNAYKRVSRQVLSSGASETVPDDSPFTRQLKLALEGNKSAYLDPLMIFAEVRHGVRDTTPLFGPLNDSGHQEGGSFLFFLKDPLYADVIPRPEPSGDIARAGSGRATLAISSVPTGAEVTINGKVVGKTPYLTTEAPAGVPLKIEARAKNQFATMDIFLKAGETRDVDIALQVLTGHLFVELEGAGYIALDGGQYKPFEGGLLRDIPTGPHLLEGVSGDAYWRERIAVISGEVQRVKPAMKQAAIVVLPKDAPGDMRFSVDQREYAAADRSIVLAGEHEVLLLHPDYERGSMSIKVEAGKIYVLDLSLFALSNRGRLAAVKKDREALLERKKALGHPALRIVETIAGGTLTLGGAAIIFGTSSGGEVDIPTVVVGGLGILLGLPLTLDGSIGSAKISNLQRSLDRVDEEIAKLQTVSR